LKHIYKRILFFIFFAAGVLLQYNLHAQTKITGTVYDISRRQPLAAVSVLSTSGAGTATDSNGVYTINVWPTDSIWFSYQNKPTPKFPVATISTPNSFDVSLHVPVTELKEVKVKPRDYKQDSIENRLTYAKAFEFQKPGFRLSDHSSDGFGVGFDLDGIINMFNFKRNKRMLAFQRRLIQEEQDKAIDHRFTKVFARKITHLNGTILDDFMKKFRPSFEFTMHSSDYEFAEYIKLAYEEYLKH
jgi:hypothetical protein